MRFYTFIVKLYPCVLKLKCSEVANSLRSLHDDNEIHSHIIEKKSQSMRGKL